MRQSVLWLWFICFAPVCLAESNLTPTEVVASVYLPKAKPKISIVIDDLGDNSVIAKKMLSLPVKLTAAILPHTPHADLIADYAKKQGHEVIMHLPMEALSRPDLLGPGAIYNNMAKGEMQSTISESADSVPNLVGFNNHMGSLLTQNQQKMQWVMESAKQFGWYFLDSKTSQVSIAQDVAEQMGIANIGRDLFLDHQGVAPSIEEQFELMQKIAIKKGHVVAICHPYPETSRYLIENLTQLQTDFEFVSVGQLIQQSHWQKLINLSIGAHGAYH
ncbi:divergent polysaccharide deacetylase family protein [Aliikangiella maris]|uniref:Divergent polysaccharide deacetylase family protein n=2 Tax=Aliikangiella maris TaxID=3162458 RepID=A0ABV2BW05_9GAMM